MTPIELIEGHAPDLGGAAPHVIERLRKGESLDIALIRADMKRRFAPSWPGQHTSLGHPRQ